MENENQLTSQSKKGGKFKNPLTAHRSIYSTSMARFLSQDPFAEMKIDSFRFLDELKSRGKCEKCDKSRKFFCYSCYIPVPELKDLVPKISNLPCSVDIIKHHLEADGKSTATHAAVISPEMVNIYTYPNFPDYESLTGAVLVFPSERAVPMEQFVGNSQIKKLIFIDSTWLQAKQIFKDPRLKELPCVVINARKSVFWRYQRGKPDDHLATIEAIYYALVNLEECEGRTYDGHFDNILFFYRYFYHKMSAMHFQPNTLTTS